MTAEAVPAAGFALGDAMGPFVGTLSAALLAYLFARRSWRAQERRKVYASFVHALAQFVEASYDWAETSGRSPAPPHPAEAERIRGALPLLRVAARDVELVGTETTAAMARRMTRDAGTIATWVALPLPDVLERVAQGQSPPKLGWDRVDALITAARADIGTDSVWGGLAAWVLNRVVDRRERRRGLP